MQMCEVLYKESWPQLLQLIRRNWSVVLKCQKSVGVIIYGIKIADRAAVCPLSKQPVCLHEADGQSAQSLIQSYKNCIPLKLIVGKETPAIINWALKDNFNLFAKEDKFGNHGGSSLLLGEGLFLLRCPVNADKKMHWAGLGSGGAAKVH
jgi:hypothetical protein